MRASERDPNRVKCFFIEPTGEAAIEVYRSSPWNRDVKCPKESGTHGHFAFLPVGTGSVLDEDGEQIAGGYLDREAAALRYGLDKFPAQCGCGYTFSDQDEWGHRRLSLYQRRDDPSIRFPLNEAPTGAMYYATWYEKHKDWCGLDGHALIVRAPGQHDWHIDGRCSNCTRKDDTVHKCWCRHGDPLTGNVTVDKNGNTCSAGAGSLLLKNWHGFLTEGWLHT